MDPRASFFQAYQVCKAKDLVPEMVFLLGRVGDNKRALNLIIERLGDVERAIEFAKEQNDDELWEDLLRYSETRPAFIRGLLENVGAEMDPLRLIRRIKDGLEIPGLKSALIKILQEFNLQLSLLDGCNAIIYQDKKSFALEYIDAQRLGLQTLPESTCNKCHLPMFESPVSLPSGEAPAMVPTSWAKSGHSKTSATLPTVYFLCRHVFHLSCLVPPERIPKRATAAAGDESKMPLISVTQAGSDVARQIAAGPERRQEQMEAERELKHRYEARLKVVLKKGCPVCHERRAEMLY